MTRTFTIPTHWTGQQALACVELLESLTGAIWMLHGTAIEEALFQDSTCEPELLPTLSTSSSPHSNYQTDTLTVPDDDLPF